MNVEINDRRVFEQIDPDVAARYLEANGWQEVKRVAGEMLIYEILKSDSFHRIWLPLNRRYRDFGSTMAVAFKTIADAEDRSELQLYDDLETLAIGDVIRMGTEDRLDKDGTSLPLQEGIAFHQQARQLMIAGAWNAFSKNPVSRRAVYPSALRGEITQFVSSLKLAQSERGSYIVRIVSPIRSDYFANQQFPAEVIPQQFPFERLAVAELLISLDVLESVARATLRNRQFRFEAFHEAVPNGVSANLCDAVAANLEESSWRPIQISVRWCRTAPAAPSVPRTEIEFSPDLLPYIYEASREFRRRQPEEKSLTAYVYEMRWADDIESPEGRITMRALVDDQWRSVRTTVQGEAYTIANEAHMTRKPIHIQGILRQDGSRIWLDNPRSVRFEDVLGD